MEESQPEENKKLSAAQKKKLKAKQKAAAEAENKGEEAAEKKPEPAPQKGAKGKKNKMAELILEKKRLQAEEEAKRQEELRLIQEAEDLKRK